MTRRSTFYILTYIKRFCFSTVKDRKQISFATRRQKVDSPIAITSTCLNHLHITKYQAPLTENYVQGTVLGSLISIHLVCQVKFYISYNKTRKGVCQGCILSPYLFNSYTENTMWNARLDDSQAGIKTEEKHQQPHICRWYHFNGRKRRRTKELLGESERGEWKSCLKTQHSKN